MVIADIIDAVKNNSTGWRDLVNAAWSCLSWPDKQLIFFFAQQNSAGSGGSGDSLRLTSATADGSGMIEFTSFGITFKITPDSLVVDAGAETSEVVKLSSAILDANSQLELSALGSSWLVTPLSVGVGSATGAVLILGSPLQDSAGLFTFEALGISFTLAPLSVT